MNKIINQTEPLILNISDTNGNKVSARYYSISFDSGESERNIKLELYGVNEGDEQGINMISDNNTPQFNKRNDVNFDYSDSWNSTITNYFTCIMENNNDSLLLLEKKLDELIARFEEQKGIIDSYFHKEREWKKTKLLQTKEIRSLNDHIEKVKTGG
jgi:hypothetical protein